MNKRVYLSIVVLAMAIGSVLTVFADYEPYVPPTESGYFKFYEDFSECTDSAGGGNSVAVSWVRLMDMSIGAPIISRDDNIKWIVTKKRSVNTSAPSSAYVDINNDRLYLKGGGSWAGMLALDTTGVIEDIKALPQESQEISFQHQAASRGTAVALFPNSDLNTYILFGIKNNEAIGDLTGIPAGAFVAFLKNGEIVNKYMSSGKSGTGTWNVKIENGIISWSMSATGGSWLGSAAFDEYYIQQSSYLTAFVGYGDGGGYLRSFSYRTGNTYTEEIPDPDEAVYIDVFDKNKVIDEEEGIYELDEPVVVRRVEYQNYSGNHFELSVDGENWDSFDRTYVKDLTDEDTINDENKGSWTLIGNAITDANRWVNTCNTKQYRYIKAPSGERVFRGNKTGIIRVFKNVSKDDCIELEKGSSKQLYLSGGSSWATAGFSVMASDENYLEIDNDSAYLALGYALIKAKKETYSRDTAGMPIKITVNGIKNKYTINIKVKGLLSAAIESQNVEDMNAYIATQQMVLGRLNEKIAQAGSGEVEAYADLQGFFSNTTLTLEDDGNGGTRPRLTINDIDLCDVNDYTLIDANFGKRISTYNSFTATSLGELEKVNEIFTREILVGKFDRLTGGTVQKRDADGTLIFGDDGVTPVFYTEDELVARVISENSVALSLPVDNKYYHKKAYYNDAGKPEDSDFAAAIRKKLANKVFFNYANLINSIKSAIVMSVFDNNSNSSFMMEMFSEYKDTIGILSDSDAEKRLKEFLSDSKKAAAFVQSIKENARKNPLSFDTPEKIMSYMNAFTFSEESESGGPPSPPKIVSPSGSGGMSVIRGPVAINAYPDKTIAIKEQVFEDVPLSHWGYEAIRYMKARGAASGYEDGYFKPDNQVTRAEFIQMLMKVFNTDVEIPENYINTFDDITEDNWFYSTVIKSSILGIFLGSDVGAEPDKSITKQEMACLIFRMVENQGKTLNRESEITKFDDEKAIADWAYTPVFKMQAAGIIAGDNGSFGPNSNATRAMAAQMLYKTMQGFEVSNVHVTSVDKEVSDDE